MMNKLINKTFSDFKIIEITDDIIGHYYSVDICRVIKIFTPNPDHYYIVVTSPISEIVDLVTTKTYTDVKVATNDASRKLYDDILTRHLSESTAYSIERAYEILCEITSSI